MSSSLICQFLLAYRLEITVPVGWALNTNDYSVSCMPSLHKQPRVSHFGVSLRGMFSSIVGLRTMFTLTKNVEKFAYHDPREFFNDCQKLSKKTKGRYKDL